MAASHGEAARKTIELAVRQHQDQGLVHNRTGSCGESRLALADPEGFLLSNDIISDVFAAFGDD